VNLREFFYGKTPLAIEASLRDKPQDWRADWNPMTGSVCSIDHKDGPILWTGNNAYGMGLFSGGPYGRGACVWGGVTSLSVFGLSPGHWLLRRAADRWLLQHGPNPESVGLGAALKAIA
jgi:hypothetical protein